MTEMFGEAWPPMSDPALAPVDDDNNNKLDSSYVTNSANRNLNESEWSSSSSRKLKTNTFPRLGLHRLQTETR